MVSDAKVAPVRARAPLAASVWHPWYVHWPFITGPVEVPIAELEVEVVVVPPTAVEVLTVEPGGTTTFVTAMHGFVGSKAKREKLVSDQNFGLSVLRCSSRTGIIRGRISKLITPVAGGNSHANVSTSGLCFPSYKLQLNLDLVCIWIAAVDWLEDSLRLITFRHKHLGRVVDFRVLD
jgi:hypothetical protein